MFSRYIDNFDFKSRFRILKGGKISLVVSALLGSAIIASAAPTAGVVTSGNATISQSGNTTNINQSTSKASINWQNFNVNSNEIVNFNQPNTNSITLNRVVGNEKSVINGTLNANGQVWILNSNGILFNSTAKVNTSGLIATTAELSDKDFQDGNYNFKNSKSNSVVNLGTIDVSNNGYVVLASNEVRNSGTIKAVKGKVYLSGNSEYTINLNGNSIVNLIVTKGVLDSMVENSGTIVANGGEIYLTTNAVNELLKGVVNNSGIIEANSLDDVTGKVEVYAHGGTANVSGTIEAKGGFVETSGKDLKVADGTIIKAKKWLIDPENVVIESTDGSDLAGSSVSATAIETALVSADVEIQATNNITVNQAISIHTEDTDISESYAFSTGDLMLTAGNDININKVITVGPNATLSLNHGWNGNTETPTYGNGGKITFGMNETKTDFEGKVVFAMHPVPESTTNGIWINDVEQTIIRNATDLQNLSSYARGATVEPGYATNESVAKALNGNFVLAADLDMTGISFVPIGRSHGTFQDYSLDFKGSFNGLGHTISNLTVKTAGGNNQFKSESGTTKQSAGLFGNIAGDALISSIRLDHVTSINDSTEYAAPTAALVGSARSLTMMVGQDLVAYNPTIHNNIVTGSTIQATVTGGNVGAIVGNAESATISGNAVTTTTVSSANNYTVGGIAGYVYSGNYAQNQASIIDNYVSSSTITSAYGKVGGIVGFTSVNPNSSGVVIDNVTVKDSSIYTTGTIQGSYGAGGIIGYATGETEIKNSSVENSIIAAMQDAGGIVGYMDMGENGAVKITNSFYNLSNTKIGDKTGVDIAQNVSGVITFGGVDNAEYVSWLPNKTMTVSGLTLTNGYYQIGSVADFRKMLAYGYDSANKFKLTSDLTLTNGLYLAVLRGELDGNNKTISGLDVSQSYNSNIGLIGRLEGGTVKNLTLTSPTLNGYSYVGGIVGSAKQNYAGTLSPTISNVTVNNFTFSYTKEFDVPTQHIDTSVYNIGAIAGEVSNGRLSNLTASGIITVNLTANNDNFNWVSADYIGGLLGGMYNSSLDTATSSVIINIDVLAKAHTNLSKNGNQAGISNIGGVIGDGSDNSLIQNVSSSGAITLSANIETTVTPEGGTGDKEGSVSIEGVGGLFGNIGQSYIKNSTATNAITLNTNGDMYGLGGIAGYTSDSLYDTITTSGNILVNLQPIDNWFENVGGAFGETRGDILKDVDSTRNITITGSTMLGGESIGGLIGYADTTNITSSSYNGTIDLSSMVMTDDTWFANVGGLVGNNYGDIEDKSYAYFRKTIAANVSTNDKLTQKEALLAEYNQRADVIALKALGYTVEDNSWGNEGDQYSVSFSLVTPEMEWGIIKDSTASINIKAGSFQNVGGLVGNMDSSDGGQIINSTVTALNASSKVEGYNNVGGLVGNNSSGNITDSHAAINVVANAVGDANIGGLVGYNEGGSRDLYNYTNIQNSYSIGDLTFALTDDGRTAADTKLEQIKDAYIVAMKALNPGYEMSYDGLYVGNNGSNYVIGGYLEFYKEQSIGAITNSYASGAVTTTGSNVGGLVGYTDTATIKTSYSTGTVNGANNVGGLVGYATGSEIIDSYHTTGKVKGAASTDGMIGGLVGKAEESSISGSYVTSEVEGEALIGGLVGMSLGSTIDKSYATGKVTALGLLSEGEMFAGAGGLVGGAMGGMIKNSYATGEVDANGAYVGGLIGHGVGIGAESDFGIYQSYATGEVTGTTQVGGLIGNSISNKIEESYSTGKVTGTSQVGGFIGQDSESTITNVYSSGEVIASGNEIGSLIGSANGTTLTNSYSSGKITLTGSDQLTVNGLIGNNADATVTNSFYDKTLNTSMADETTHGKTTEELQTKATFTGIQSNPWDMSGENGGYATLDLSSNRTNVWKMAKAGPTAAELAVIAALEAATNAKNNTLTATGNVSTSLTTANGAVTSANTANTAINTAINNVERLTTPSDIQGAINIISNNIATLTTAKTTAQTALRTAQTAKTLAEQKAILAKTAYDTALSAGATIEQLSAVLALVNEANSAVTSATTALATTQTQVSTLDGLINIANTKLEVANVKVAILNATSNVTTAITTATSAITTATVASESINTTISNIEGTVNLALVESAINTISNNITTLTNAKTTAQTALQTAQTAKALAEQKAILAQTAYDTALSEGATIEQLSAVVALVNEANSAVISATTALAAVQTRYNTLDNMITVANLNKIEVEKYASDLAISNQNTEKAVTAAIKAPIIPVMPVIPKITMPTSVDVKPATQIKQDVALSLGISDMTNVSLVSQTTVGQSNQVISMSDLKSLTTTTSTEGSNVSEVRVPLSQNSIVDLVNGGVTLPTGVDQQFFVVATDNTNTNSSTTTTTNENNKNKKGKKAN